MICDYWNICQYNTINDIEDVRFFKDIKEIRKDIGLRFFPLRKMEWKRRKWRNSLLLFMAYCTLMFARPTISEQGKTKTIFTLLFSNTVCKSIWTYHYYLMLLYLHQYLYVKYLNNLTANTIMAVFWNRRIECHYSGN